MFHGASLFNIHIRDWNTSNALTMASMFDEASSFNQDLSPWDVTNVRDFGLMFRKATALNQNFCDWNLTKGESAGRMFFGTNCTDDRDPRNEYCDGTGKFIGPYCFDCGNTCVPNPNKRAASGTIMNTDQLQVSLLSGVLGMLLFWM